MDELRIVAPFHEQTGYSKHARALLRTALLAGYRVQAVESDYHTVLTCTADPETGQHTYTRRRAPKRSFADVPPVQQSELLTALATEVAAEAPTILLQLPHCLTQWQEYNTGPQIGYTMVECDGVRPEVAHALRGVDLLAAPSSYVAGVFGKYVSGTVAVLPDPVDDRLFDQDVTPLAIAGRPSFLFLNVGTSHERKHWRELMHAFCEEFRHEDVGLLLKCNPAQDMQNLAFSCRDYGAWVWVEDESFTDERMASLYRAADCIVGVGHEGFGLPFVEAGFYGKASVALSIGGQADVVSEASGYLVPARMTPCVGLVPRYFPSSASWATCSVPDLRKTLRRAYEGREGGDFHGTSLRYRGEVAQARAMTFTPGQLAGRLREVVQMGRERWAGR